MTEQSLPVIAWLSLKIAVLIGIGVYGVFAGVMVRQEHLMAHVLEEGFEPVLRLLTYVHLALSVIVFIFALILL
jgi:hypothetical protein